MSFFIFAFPNVWNDRASVLSGAEVTSEMRGLRRCAKDTEGCNMYVLEVLI